METGTPPRDTTEQATRLRLAVTRMARRLRQEAGSELGPSALASLGTVERRGPLTPSELAAAEGIQRPTATRIIARLEEESLVVRTADPSDGRCSVITISADGRRLLKKIRGRKNAYLATKLRGLSGADLAALERAETIIERMLEEDRK